MNATELLKKKKPRVRVVEIVLDEALRVDREQLVRKIRRAEKQEAWDGGDMKSPIPKMQAQLDQLDAKLAEVTISLTFQAIPRTDWLKLVELCEDDGEVTEEFAQAIVQASALEPKFSKKQVAQMWGEWSSAETDEMYLAAWKVNREVRDIPFISDGIEEILNTVLKSTTADQED
jgi:hypothetical protein